MPRPRISVPALLLLLCLAPPLSVQAQDCRLSLAPPAFVAAAQDDLHALPQGRSAGHNAFHGQALYGLENPYLSHLPVFMGAPENHPHNFQVILEVDFADADARAAYVAERGSAPMSLYTATPPDFDQTALVVDYAGRAAIETLPATTIVEGHFEQGGQAILDDVTFDVGRVVYFREFQLGGEPLGEQSYVIFGRGGEAFAAHLLSAPPDFDQMLAVEVTASDDAPALEDALAAGIYLTLPGRANDESNRIQAGETLSCSLAIDGAAAPITVEVAAAAEIYCEAGEFSAVVMQAFNTPRRCTTQ